MSVDITIFCSLSVGVWQTKIVWRRNIRKRGVRKITERTEHGSVPSRHVF